MLESDGKQGETWRCVENADIESYLEKLYYIVNVHPFCLRLVLS